MRWQFGSVLPEEIKLNLCEPELEFFGKYNKILANYMRSLRTDLTTDMAPPKTLYVEVRVLQDHGEVETTDGELVLLKEGSQHHLPRDLCEQLIMQGVLEHVTA
jgi:GINS complex subunit 1